MREALVFGIDPSIAATGVALPSGSSHTIKTIPTDGDARLHQLARTMDSYLVRFEQLDSEVYSVAVVEDLPMNAKSAGLTGMAQGVIRERLAYYEIPVARIAPASLKKYATGSGRASKADMRAAWLELTENDIADDNQVDALWLRDMGVTAWDVTIGIASESDFPDYVRPYLAAIRRAFDW